MRNSNTHSILVLGGDGYLGWPLTLRLARENPHRHIVMVDNLLRRELVTRQGGDSLLPVHSPVDRVAACREIYGLNNIEYLPLDVNSDGLDELVQSRRPTAIYHLAQQCSAPFSMSNRKNALFTLRNNEEGNMRLLWAVRESVPDCHIIKLGTFGEYAKSGLDIAEGYFRPSYKGKTAARDVPYPRQSDDFYHASKINDTNYISVACRSWGLRVTDVMQSTIVGAWTPDIGAHPRLYTRLDYDEQFGTVVNRFLAQALSGVPLTVYGSGHQRTGLMSLNDSVSSMSKLWDAPPKAGEHRVINHLTEAAFSINELAETVAELVEKAGYPVTLEQGVHDPRGETETQKLAFAVERHYLNGQRQPGTQAQHESLDQVVKRTLALIRPYKSRISKMHFIPRTAWRGEAPQEKSRVVPLTVAKQNSLQSLQQQRAWERFQQTHFPYQHINLNPGTLGSPSRDVLDAIEEFHCGEVMAQPLLQYGNGRQALYQAVAIGDELWPTPAHKLHITGGASQCSNLIALCMTRIAGKLQRKLKVLATPHEHIGGMGAFERLSEFEVHYLSNDALACQASFQQQVEALQADIFFFSHIAYDSGCVFPVEQWAKTCKAAQPAAPVIIDISQSLGLLPPPFANADMIFGSCHKWLFGPRGTGLMWTTAEFRQQVEAINFSGDPLLQDAEAFGFSPAGGQDFASLSGIVAALQLMRDVGHRQIVARSRQLAEQFRRGLSDALRRCGIAHRFLSTGDGAIGESGVICLAFDDYDPYPLYHAMNQQGVHSKCIKDTSKLGEARQLMRFGIPYYETEARLEKALSVVNACLQRLTSAQGHTPQHRASAQSTTL